MTQVQLTIRSSGHCFAEGHHVMKGAPKTPVRFEAIYIVGKSCNNLVVWRSFSFTLIFLSPVDFDSVFFYLHNKFTRHRVIG